MLCFGTSGEDSEVSAFGYRAPPTRKTQGYQLEDSSNLRN